MAQSYPDNFLASASQKEEQGCPGAARLWAGRKALMASEGSPEDEHGMVVLCLW